MRVGGGAGGTVDKEPVVTYSQDGGTMESAIDIASPERREPNPLYMKGEKVPDHPHFLERAKMGGHQLIVRAKVAWPSRG